MNYEIKNSESDHKIVKEFNNLHTIVEVAKALEVTSLQLEDLSIVKKFHQIDQNQLKMFAEQNNIKYDENIIKNALFDSIRQAINSASEFLFFPDEIVEEITSYLEYSDIIIDGTAKLTGDIFHL